MKIGTCYICGAKGPVDEHHIWMQSAGGKEGPIVDLCQTDHTKIHKQALNIESKAEKIDLFTPQEWIKAKPLVEYIILAIRKNRENPNFNDPYQLMIKMTKKDVFHLHLMKADSGYTNLNDYLKDLLKAFIKSKFPLQ